MYKNQYPFPLIFSMAEDAVDAAIKKGKLSPSSGCITAHLPIVGAYGWEPSLFVVLAQSYLCMKISRDGAMVPKTMDSTIAKHLSHAYGSMAGHVAAIAQVRIQKLGLDS